MANRLSQSISEADFRSQGASDQINLKNTSEVYLEGATSDVLRAQELVVQSTNPLYDSSTLQSELDSIVDSVNQTAQQVLGTDTLLPTLNVSAAPADNLKAIESAAQHLGSAISQFGAESNGLSSQINTYQIQIENSSAARSRIEDTDFAQSTTELAQIRTQRETLIELQKDEDERKGRVVNQFI
ncbi:hypothetical protein NAF29_03965 [Echinimonas agarilytica]|uniref:Flagellin C-terminal domain-containing protein n=1 Tax=Echinimonas agarilytica TaxID=1215918 RepID=A0AA41W4W9_9GAMM|nr:hypothetical protein [Echinimonas agarilytica]